VSLHSGVLLNATKWLLGAARATHEDLEVELINLADNKVGKGVGKWVGTPDGRTVEQYLEDAAPLIRSVHPADGVIIASSVDSPIVRGYAESPQ